MKDHNYDRDSETPIDVKKVVTKSAIGWLVPTLLGVVCLGLLALGDARMQAMLTNYQTKEQATQLEKEHNSKEDRLQTQIENLQSTLDTIDKKLDHLQYVIEYAQEHNKLTGPKANGNQ